MAGEAIVDPGSSWSVIFRTSSQNSETGAKTSLARFNAELGESTLVSKIGLWPYGKCRVRGNPQTARISTAAWKSRAKNSATFRTFSTGPTRFLFSERLQALAET